MFSFTKEQKVFDISGISIGGQPGMYPTVLFGGLFFKGEPDFEDAKRHLQIFYERSKQTGVPVIPDFFIRKVEYIESILSFIEKVIPRKQPFSIDIIEPSLKIQTLEQLASRKLLPRTIYNSLHIGMTAEENEALKKFTPEAAIIVAFNPKDKSPDGKIEVLENGAHLLENGLLKTAQNIGIKKLLVDTAALAPGENSGAAIAAIPVVKEEYGLPTGCAIHNVVEKSRWLNDFPFAKKTVDVSSNNAIPLFGGDYALFGPIENTELIVPLIAWQDILISEYTENYFGINPVATHPRRKLLK
jgi:tetrahydromethanopterin S-methyltransferase subunit H